MKLLTLLLSLMFLLGACGEEAVKKGLQQKEDYRYVEIEECMIPIPKRFEKLKQAEGYLYRFSYYTNLTDMQSINIRKSEKDAYLNAKTHFKQDKNTILKADYTKNNFKILVWSLINPVLEERHYVLFGPKTKINLANSNKTEINYLLDYCQKTWKLDKEKDN